MSRELHFSRHSVYVASDRQWVLKLSANLVIVYFALLVIRELQELATNKTVLWHALSVLSSQYPMHESP